MRRKPVSLDQHKRGRNTITKNTFSLQSHRKFLTQCEALVTRLQTYQNWNTTSINMLYSAFWRTNVKKCLLLLVWHKTQWIETEGREGRFHLFRLLLLRWMTGCGAKAGRERGGRLLTKAYLASGCSASATARIHSGSRGVSLKKNASLLRSSSWNLVAGTPRQSSRKTRQCLWNFDIWTLYFNISSACYIRRLCQNEDNKSCSKCYL